jgi:hypothetical protein
MATAQQIENGASSFNQLANKLDALIYLLNTSNMTAQQISAGAAQFNQLANKLDCIIYLLASATGGGTGTGATFGNYGGGIPSFTPTGGTGLAVDTSNGAIWAYYNGGWN